MSSLRENYCKCYLNLNEEYYLRALYTQQQCSNIFFVDLVHTRHIRFHSRSPRSHVKPSVVVCVSPKIQVSHALDTSRYGYSSARTMRAEVRGRSGAHIMVTWRVFPFSPQFLVCPR